MEAGRWLTVCIRHLPEIRLVPGRGKLPPLMINLLRHYRVQKEGSRKEAARTGCPIPSSAAYSRVFDTHATEAGSGRRQIDRPYLLRLYRLGKRDFVRQGGRNWSGFHAFLEEPKADIRVMGDDI